MITPRRVVVAFSLLLLLFRAQPFSAATTPSKPRLVVGIIIDQFRYDYLTRFGASYHGGLHQLLTQGADFTNAFYTQVPTVTAVGHSIFMSGAMPAVSGIIANSWYERSEEQVVTSVCDWNEQTVGGATVEKGTKCTDSDPGSPRRLLVTTLGDELRVVDRDAKVIGISIKARGAILPSGHRAQGAFWFDDQSGNFVSSTYYVKQLPEWASDFNNRKLPAKYVGQKWEGFPNWSFRPANSSQPPYSPLPASPWGNELIEGFAEQAINGEKLGQRAGKTDLLTISFSANDYVGHAVGPDAPEVRDMALRTDQLLGKLFSLIDQKIGLQNVIVVLSADHGVAATPNPESNMPGGYIAVDFEDAVQSALNRRFGKNTWLIPGAGETSVYFDRNAIENFKTADGKRVSEAEVFQAAKEELLSIPLLHVARVYTRNQLDNGVRGDFIAQAETNGYFPRRSGDLAIVFEPGYIPGTSGTTHFSPYAYDRHVPLLFMGQGIKAGHYDETVTPNDVAPTLATVLEIQTPSGSSGRVLREMIAQ